MAAASPRNREFDFLCAAARPRFDLAAVGEQLESGLDFDRLLALAAGHSVRPHLIRALAHLKWTTVPPSVRAELEAFQHRHLPKSLAFVGELRRVAEAFDRQAIPFATFKGVALATFLYGDPAAREFADIDIIVPQRHMADAERALAELGYRAALGDRRFRAAFLAIQRQFGLINPEIGMSVDLHWQFSGDYVPFPLSADDALRNAVALSVAGRDVPTLAPADLASLLAGHGTKEQWRSLELIVDFAWLVDRLPGLDWLDLYRRARARRCGRAVLLGLLLANRVLGVALPEALVATIERHEEARARADVLIERIRRDVALPQSNFVDLELCDRPSDRLKAMMRLALLPTAGDYKAWPLPSALWGVYYATRPFRLVAKALGGRLRGG